jgi:hypothetical protein
MESVTPGRRPRGPDGRYLHRDAFVRWDGQVRVLHWDDPDEEPERPGSTLVLYVALGLTFWAFLFWVGFAVWPVFP